MHGSKDQTKHTYIRRLKEIGLRAQNMPPTILGLMTRMIEGMYISTQRAQ